MTDESGVKVITLLTSGPVESTGDCGTDRADEVGDEKGHETTTEPKTIAVTEFADFVGECSRAYNDGELGEEAALDA